MVRSPLLLVFGYKAVKRKMKGEVSIRQQKKAASEEAAQDGSYAVLFL